jgi:hypothetical protein
VCVYICMYVYIKMHMHAHGLGRTCRKLSTEPHELRFFHMYKDKHIYIKKEREEN